MIAVVATAGILSVKPVYAINPGWVPCTGAVCPSPTPAASEFTPGATSQKSGGEVPAKVAAPGPSNNLPPGIAFHIPQ